MTSDLTQRLRNKTRALVVDDEASSTLILTSLLEALGLSVDTASDAEQMQACLGQGSFEIIFLDYKLGSRNGLELLGKIIGDFPRVKVVMITAHGSIDLVVQAMRSGAAGFIEKPFCETAVAREVDRALTWRSASSSLTGTRGNIVGTSPAISRIHEQIEKMKDVDSTVLIVGESGTGKELIARALHDRSVRARQRFEAINCAAIPENLLESELFGHKRGAFTDAKTDRKGLFEVCSQGTLFLDEIGDLPLTLQSKLLRVLQEKVVVPLGSSTSVKVQTRIVAATNLNLLALVKRGEFRRDLFYRLSILQIEAPPLRDRLEDVAELTEYFIATMSERFGRKIKPLTNELLARLLTYDWPGNVRELQNSLERAIILSEDGTNRIEDVFSRLETLGDEETVCDMSGMKELSLAKDEFEKKYLERLLTATKGNVSEASRVAGRIRTDMYRLFTKYKIDPSLYKT